MRAATASAVLVLNAVAAPLPSMTRVSCLPRRRPGACARGRGGGAHESRDSLLAASISESKDSLS